MKKPNQVLALFERYQKELDPLIEAYLKSRGSSKMYGMMRYFMGFTDVSFRPTKVYGGKRFRPALALFIADAFNAKKRVMDAAMSIELFHNFTLIHDDIVDGDTLRRGRETVWKIWGVDEAINTGDAQSLLACQKLIECAQKYPDTGVRIAESLVSFYREVAEGQHLDFALAKLPIDDSGVTEKAYRAMIEKKTAVLVGASAKAGALAGGCSPKESEQFFRFGQSLGFAYQLYDDYADIWGGQEVSGRDLGRDLKEKKKTLPVIHAFQSLSESERKSFAKMYNASSSLTSTSVQKVLRLINATDAKEYTKSAIQKAVVLSRDAAKATSLPNEKKDILLTIIDALIPLV
ncbi:MAG: polyprenyl synthetase family protein [Candidatus Pacebacteria bacterium]|nr:polyprenyl synthetase family protein [Candidatus Paceibacterota bacterium]MDD5356885.1 polyprenyl synthetase family protein [Candidatus Paceibacterota bacterium]